MNVKKAREIVERVDTEIRLDRNGRDFILFKKGCIAHIVQLDKWVPESLAEELIEQAAREMEPQQ